MHSYPCPSWRCSAAALLCAAAFSVQAGPIVLDTFGQFSFEGVDSAAQGCQPDDPIGGFCIPSSTTPTVFLDAPAWTFTAGAGGALLTVVDAFEATDRFEIFDFGVSIGLTSPLPLGNLIPDCGDDPLDCLATAGMSKGSFALGAGNHSITLVARESGGLGSGYLRVNAATAIPEPTTLALLLCGLAAAIGTRRSARVAGTPL